MRIAFNNCNLFHILFSLLCGTVCKIIFVFSGIRIKNQSIDQSYQIKKSGSDYPIHWTTVRSTMDFIVSEEQLITVLTVRSTIDYGSLLLELRTEEE